MGPRTLLSETGDLRTWPVPPSAPVGWHPLSRKKNIPIPPSLSRPSRISRPLFPTYPFFPALFFPPILFSAAFICIYIYMWEREEERQTDRESEYNTRNMKNSHGSFFYFPPANSRKRGQNSHGRMRVFLPVHLLIFLLAGKQENCKSLQSGKSHLACYKMKEKRISSAH